jgi:hypothetical protein
LHYRLSFDELMTLAPVVVECECRNLRGTAVNYQDLIDWVEANPFEPFRLSISDGRRFDITTARMIWPGRYSTMIGLPDNPSEPDVPGRHITLANVHIVTVEPLPVSQQA